MPLSAGDLFGPYEILAPIGAGGMGEVYRARDRKLDREVAIKVLPALLAQDPDRLARFEREAKVLASLNHPNIAHIYGLEERGETRALAMELVPGATLAVPQPLERVLDYAQQIAEALETAHEKSITHRDLKPANIMVTPEGVVKVLDFGLASIPTREGDANAANSPTMTMAATQAGVILGTAAYMSPEQASGRPVDRRADIWSFGVVLYEMLAGRQLFSGETVSHTLADVLRAPIDLGQLPTSTPPAIRTLVERCLDRNVKTRLQSIGEARIAIERYRKDPKPAVAAAEPASTPVRATSRLWVIATVVFGLATAALSYIAYRHSTEEPPRVERFSLLTPEKAELNNSAAIPQISPDGRRIVLAARVDGQIALWIRDLDALTPRMLPGTANAGYPFWAPDSRWVGFFADNKLKKIDVTGGPALTLCDVATGRGGSWSQADVIVYGVNGGGLFRVPASGGTPAALSKTDPASERSHRFPFFLPDGHRFLYTARGTDADKSRIYVDTIDSRPESKTRKEVAAADSNAIYVPRAAGSEGYLLFVRERTLMAQPFDPVRIQTTGDALPAAEQVDYFPAGSSSNFSASRNGTLVYTSGATTGGNRQLTWFDRNGKLLSTVGMPANTAWARLAPDDSRIASDPADASGLHDIWVFDVARGTSSRFTFGPVNNQYPLWSPDASRIGFYSGRLGVGNPYLKNSNGVGADELVYARERGNHRIEDWSRDGRYFIEGVVDPKTQNDIWVIPQFGDKKPFPYVNSEYHERDARLSPSGQFLAYGSDESKRDEIYVQTFPEHGGKWQISTAGGRYVAWSRDGREIYFLSADRKVMAVEVKGAGNSFQAGVPKALFSTTTDDPFDVSKDGRFLLQVPLEQGSSNVPLTVVTNWQSALKK